MEEPFDFGSAPEERGEDHEEPAPEEASWAAEVPMQEADSEVGIVQLVDELTAERDEYLKALQLTKADFDNYRRRTQRMESEAAERRVLGLLEKLLPSLDDLNSLYVHKLGSEDEDLVTKTVLPVFAALASEGLERFDATGVAFDPAMHQAVVHEEGDDGPTVAEVFRAGYSWKGRTLRPAMVKVVG